MIEGLRRTTAREWRTIGADQFRAMDTGKAKALKVLAVKYRVVDEYGSVWTPGVFDRSISERWPTLCWAHDWADILGRGFAWQRASEGPIIQFYFDDFDSVPRAKQAYAQVQSGTVDEVSVGFSNITRRSPTEEERRLFPGVKEVMLDADLDEVSLVLRGAVPGAKVLAVRSRSSGRDDELDPFDFEAFKKTYSGRTWWPR